MVGQRQKYSVFYADPPWYYRERLQHGKRKSSDGAACHYPTVPVEELAKIDIPGISKKNAVMFMWVGSPLLEDAMYLLKEWGFTYKTIAFVWDKGLINPGYYTLSRCEMCIVGTKGKIPSPRGSRKERQFYSQRREGHSEKPIEFRKRIERMFPYHKKLELFSRSLVYGWDVFGYDVEHLDNSIDIPRRLMVRRR